MCVRRCPTFPPGLGGIIGAGRLSFRVRDGSGRFPVAMFAVTLFFCVGEWFPVGVGGFTGFVFGGGCGVDGFVVWLRRGGVNFCVFLQRFVVGCCKFSAG